MTGSVKPPTPPLPPSVLVVDADADTRALYGQCVTLVGSQVLEATDGRDGLVKALGRRPSLVLTELALPLVDGYALCEILRRDRVTASVPILVVTAEVRPAPLARAWRAGADSILLKPVLPEEIVNEMRRLLAAPMAPRWNAADIRPEGATPAEQEATALDSPGHRRRPTQTQAFHRNRTMLPPSTPPALICPACDGQLRYEHSHIGGVNKQQSEQWDHYLCMTCGTFQYRHRTRKLRRIS